MQKRVQGRKVMGGQSSYLPIKINAAGVIPIIFASCLIYFPAQIAALFNVDWLTMVANAISAGWVNWILTALLIVFFAYFYTSIVFNPRTLRKTFSVRVDLFPVFVLVRIPCSTLRMFCTQGYFLVRFSSQPLRLSLPYCSTYEQFFDSGVWRYLDPHHDRCCFGHYE